MVDEVRNPSPNGLIYNLEHCFIIKAGNSSKPGADVAIM